MAYSRPYKEGRRLEETHSSEYDTVVIRNLSPTTDKNRIATELACHGYEVLDIKNAVHFVTKEPSPLFFLKLMKSPFNENIFKVKEIANQQVYVEKFRPPPDLPRCTNCQDIGHLAKECFKKSVCGYCSGHHKTRHCGYDRDVVPTCANCGGPHPSNYKGCPEYKRRVNEVMKTNPCSAADFWDHFIFEEYRPASLASGEKFTESEASASFNGIQPTTGEEDEVVYSPQFLEMVNNICGAIKSFGPDEKVRDIFYGRE